VKKMAYTEIKEKNKNKYYYRVKSIREGEKFKKKRVYLGKDISDNDLKIKENEADKILNKNDKRSVELNKLIPKIKEILFKKNIKKAGIFGSYARGDQKEDSDIDILIEPTEGMGLEFYGLYNDLKKELGMKVDLLTYDSINPHLKQYILGDEVRII
jgi:uncharacterized protein